MLIDFIRHDWMTMVLCVSFGKLLSWVVKRCFMLGHYICSLALPTLHRLTLVHTMLVPLCIFLYALIYFLFGTYLDFDLDLWSQRLSLIQEHKVKVNQTSKIILKIQKKFIRKRVGSFSCQFPSFLDRIRTWIKEFNCLICLVILIFNVC